MKILIAGPANTGQQQVVEKLTGKDPTSSSLAGLTMDHTFVTKYFTADCGIWVDEIDDIESWSDEFSGEEAKDVRDAMILFIYTFDPENETLNLSNLSAFTDLLEPGACLAVPMKDAAVAKSVAASIEEAGLEIIEPEELVPIVHSALFDAQSERQTAPHPSETAPHSSESDHNAHTDFSGTEAPRDLDEIMAELIQAKNSKTMTKEEKQALAERLAAELV